jgi:hypothetical protein
MFLFHNNQDLLKGAVGTRVYSKQEITVSITKVLVTVVPAKNSIYRRLSGKTKEEKEVFGHGSWAPALVMLSMGNRRTYRETRTSCRPAKFSAI